MRWQNRIIVLLASRPQFKLQADYILNYKPKILCHNSFNCKPQAEYTQSQFILNPTQAASRSLQPNDYPDCDFFYLIIIPFCISHKPIRHSYIQMSLHVNEIIVDDILVCHCTQYIHNHVSSSTCGLIIALSSYLTIMHLRWCVSCAKIQFDYHNGAMRVVGTNCKHNWCRRADAWGWFGVTTRWRSPSESIVVLCMTSESDNILSEWRMQIPMQILLWK